MAPEITPSTNGKGKPLPAALLPLTELRHWVIWRWEVTETGERTKVPYQAHNPRYKALVNKPSTWATYDEAVAAARTADGIGFVLTDTEFAAFDIDHCRNAQTGELHPWATGLMARAGSYTEITPSNTGVRIVGKGTGPKLDSTKIEVKDGVSCEFYRKSTRYITITGNSIWEVPIANVDAVFDTTYDELIAQKKKEKGGGDRQIDLDDVIKNGRYELFLNDAKKPDKSRAVWYVINQCLRKNWEVDKIVATLLDRTNKISEHGYEAHRSDAEKYARDQIAKAREQLEKRLVSAIDHMRRARQFRAQHSPNLRHWRGDFYDWAATSYYQRIEEDTIKAQIWKYLEQALVRNDKGIIQPFYPNTHSVNETLAALKAIAQLDDNRETPFWIDGGIAGELIAFPNGLLELSSDRLHKPNPDFFTLGALSFNYQPKRGDPAEWLKFLDQIFDKESDGKEAQAQIKALQEVFGYLLTSDISQEKCFMLLGPPRSGKGTMARMTGTLLASTTVAGPTLSEFGTEFGLSALIGKQLAIIDDLRVARKDQNLMVENVLKITGRGYFTLNRKYKPFWNGVLPIKLMIISNEMPRLGDDSPALSGRFIILTTRKSFLGQEDPDLFETKLRPELVDVLHWALDGLRRLRKERKFTEPQASKDARDRMANLGSLVMAFIADECELKLDVSMDKDVLFRAYKDYAITNDMIPDRKEKFFEALYAATGGKVKPARPREEGKRVMVCQGIRLRQKEPQQRDLYDKLDERPPQRHQPEPPERHPDDPGPEGCYRS